MRKAALLGLCLAGCTATAQPVPQGESPTRWLGIEYATAERWQLPVANADWAADAPFDAEGPACPQAGQSVMVEDCLFLNVFAPEGAKDLPVLVSIHGGGFIAGAGGTAAESFTRDGLVVVTFNYRLGQLGFHDWPGWSESDPRNFGQADMVAALEWVQDNIRAFGGDPDAVTIMGHSAGGMGVQLMMVDERAQPLFARAFSHAGYGSWPFPEAFNPDAETRTRIRYGALRTDMAAETLVGEITAYHLPYTDAPHLKVQPEALFGSTRKPFVAGANSFDGAGTLRGAGFTPETLLERIDSPALRAAYADDFAVSDEQAAQRIFGDMRYLYSSMRAAEGFGGHLFLYDAARPGAPGAYHGQQYDSVLSGEPSAFRDAVVSFAKTGDPGWPRVADGAYARFGPELSARDPQELAGKWPVLRDALQRVATP